MRINDVGIDRIMYMGQEVEAYISGEKIRKNLFSDNKDGRNEFTPTKSFPIQPPVSKIINGGEWDALTWSGDINIGDCEIGDIVSFSVWYLPYTSDLGAMDTNPRGIAFFANNTNSSAQKWVSPVPNWNGWILIKGNVEITNEYKFNCRLEDMGYDYSHPGDAPFTTGYWCNATIYKN